MQPDSIVICDTETIDAKGKYRGVLTLVVEVLSISSKKHDMLESLIYIRKTGIREFWLVDTDKKTILTYCFEDKFILDNNAFVGDGIVKSSVFKDLEISLKEVFS